MKAVEFPEVNVRIAESQPEYETLPAFHNPKEGSMTFCFELSPDELEQIGKTGKIYIKQLTFNRAMQPIAGTCLKEELITSPSE